MQQVKSGRRPAFFVLNSGKEFSYSHPDPPVGGEGFYPHEEASKGFNRGLS